MVITLRVSRHQFLSLPTITQADMRNNFPPTKNWGFLPLALGMREGELLCCDETNFLSPRAIQISILSLPLLELSNNNKSSRKMGQ